MSEDDVRGWVFIREYKQDLLHFGWLKYYSDSYAKREVVLLDVKVYSNSIGEFKYKTNYAYLTLDEGDFSIESPSFETGGEKDEQE